MNHHWTSLFSFVIDVAYIKSFWKIHIELNCSTLPDTIHAIFDFKVKFWTIEGTITWINLEFFAGFTTNLFKDSFGFIPNLDISNVAFFWTSR